MMPPPYGRHFSLGWHAALASYPLEISYQRDIARATLPGNERMASTFDWPPL
jgi:hypothetical protein